MRILELSILLSMTAIQYIPIVWVNEPHILPKQLLPVGLLQHVRVLLPVLILEFREPSPGQKFQSINQSSFYKPQFGKFPKVYQARPIYTHHEVFIKKLNSKIRENKQKKCTISSFQVRLGYIDIVKEFAV